MFDRVIVNPLIDFLGGHSSFYALADHVEHAYVHLRAAFDCLDILRHLQRVARRQFITALC